MRRPRLVTPDGCRKISALLRKSCRRLGLSSPKLAAWIEERVELPDGISIKPGTLRSILGGRYPLIECKHIEILACCGILEPLTYDEVWAIATETAPSAKEAKDIEAMVAQIPLSELPSALRAIARRLELPSNEDPAAGLREAVDSWLARQGWGDGDLFKALADRLSADSPAIAETFDWYHSVQKRKPSPIVPQALSALLTDEDGNPYGVLELERLAGYR